MNWYKRAQYDSTRLRGEWWFIDGRAHYADIEVGDAGHAGMAIDFAGSRIMDSIMSAMEEEAKKDAKMRSAVDEVIRKMHNSEQVYLREDMSKIEEEFPEAYERIVDSAVAAHGEETVDVAFGRGYPIGWGLAQGWVRCKGNWLEMGKLTSDTLKNAASGISEAWGEELTDETKFSIEVSPPENKSRSTMYFAYVPLAIIERGNPSMLLQYRERTF